MDIYKPPITDTCIKRPLIILAHSGAFVGGNRTSDIKIDSLCVRFAKRGYVVASIEYRLGSQATMQVDSIYAEKVMINAIMDGKAAIRYFVKDAATANVYKIDTTNIFVGGNSAGAILYTTAAYMLDTAKCSQSVKNAIALQGGIEGNSGNAGYSSKVKGVVCLAGAVHSLEYIDSSSVPCFMSQGDADKDVPFGSGCLLKKPNLIHIYLFGSEKMDAALSALGVYHRHFPLHGEEHVPWNTSVPIFNTVDAQIVDFLYSLLCQ